MENDTGTAGGKDNLGKKLDYGWKWFELHAKQRMQLFGFFVIATGILINGFVNAVDGAMYGMAVAVAGVGAVLSLGFFCLDLRSRELTRHGEDVLEAVEADLFGGVGPDPKGPLQVERASNMREGSWSKRGFKNLLKMKVWIRMLNVLALAAWILAGWWAHGRTSEGSGPVPLSSERAADSLLTDTLSAAGR